MKFTTKIAIVFSALIVLLLISISEEKTEKESTPFQIITFKVNDGWGFDLYRNEKKIIRQEHIPAVNGVQFFKTEKEAKKIADLMKIKIQNNIFPPSVSLTEIDSLKIKYLP